MQALAAAGLAPWMYLVLAPLAQHRVPPFRAWSGGRASGVIFSAGRRCTATHQPPTPAFPCPACPDPTLHAPCLPTVLAWLVQGGVITQCFPSFYYAVHETGHRMGFRHANMYK